MYSIYLSAFLFFSILVLFSIIILKDFKSIKIFCSPIKCILIISLFFICRFLVIDDISFYGLEYEDAYIYNASSYYNVYNEQYFGDSFLTQSCISGSIKDCNLSATYSGHLVGFTGILTIIHKTIGFYPSTINYLNLIMSFFTLILIYVTSLKIVKDEKYAIICSLIYLLCPIVNIYYGSGHVEPFSGFFMLLGLYIFMTIFEDQKFSSLNYSLFISTFFYLSIIKRENLAILLLLIGVFIFVQKYKKDNLKVYAKPIILALLIMCLIFFSSIFMIDFNKTINAEYGDINNQFPFGFDFFFTLFPIFLKSLFTFEYFSIYPIIFAFLMLILTFLNIKKYYKFLYPCIISISYALIYTFHYRGYYFFHQNAIEPIEMVRYIMNFFPFIVILSSGGIYYLCQKSKIFEISHLRIVFSITVVTSLLSSIIITDNMLKGFSDKEKKYHDMSKYISDNYYMNKTILLTDNSLIYQSLLNKNLDIIDFTFKSENYEDDIISKISNKNNKILLLYSKRLHDMNYERMKSQLYFIDNFEKSVVKENSVLTLYEINL